MRALGIAVVVLCSLVACDPVSAPIIDAGPTDGPTVDVPADCEQRSCSATADGCCPTGCNANVDPDCAARCGNGVVEGAETCDPVGTCPTACPQEGCALRTLANPGTCTAACVDSGTQTQCVLGVDGCCPAGCTPGNDTDCAAVCGNGTIEAGETCDPLASCPADCPPQGCQLFTLSQPGTCRADCLPAGQQTACQNDDGCCPGGCNATNDSDCQPACGNGVVEAGETCDPLGSCPGDCPALGCQLRTLQGAGTCAAACVDDGEQTACVGGDLCCPAGCDATNDSDCAAGCGNGVVEAGESCDPVASCPTDCPPQGCTLYSLTGGGTCQATCEASGTQTMCANGDGCCPPGCNALNDADCGATCGNDVVEPGETCDPPGSCACPQEPFTCYTTTGSAGTCDLRCHVPVQACGTGDDCCAFDGTTGCGASTDGECAGGDWRSLRWPQDVAYTSAQCTTIPVSGLVVGGSYVFTTCVPPGLPRGSGDPVISSVTDSAGTSYNITNDDCSDATALVNLAGWDCQNDGAALRMSCASPSPGGFRVRDANTFVLFVKICPYAGTAFGTAPFHVWFNAPTPPHPG